MGKESIAKRYSEFGQVHLLNNVHLLGAKCDGMRVEVNTSNGYVIRLEVKKLYLHDQEWQKTSKEICGLMDTACRVGKFCDILKTGSNEGGFAKKLWKTVGIY